MSGAGRFFAVTRGHPERSPCAVFAACSSRDSEALALAEVPSKTLATRLGHSGVPTTCGPEADALIEDQRDATEALAARLDRTP